ncbi:MAG TPA: RadC family protein [Clostridia bacterium]|jgi:DNA repair protein RadC|nr:RadC family protein [Clostridia bacterium]
MGKNVHQGHRQRVRERFLEEGLDGFADHQVLELLLFYCIPRRDTNKLAHRLINEFGTLANLCESRPEDIIRRCQVSKNTAILISLVPHLARRYQQNRWREKPFLGGSAEAGRYAISLFVGRVYEAFFMLCLDGQNRLNEAVLVNEGTINEAPIYPRNIIETALRYQAVKVVLAHNHPGGSLKPSPADLQITQLIKNALKAISVKVVDHIIVAGEEYLSMAEEGLL